MRGAMANSSQSHNVHGASRPATRDRSPDPPMGRSGCCTGFLCLGSLKRGKRIVPATRIHDGSNSSPRPWGSNGAPQSNPANLYATLSPSLLAPPSSPASFQNSAVQSSAQSPCAFPVAMSAPSATSQIPLETAQTMFQMGPYAHETALVSPPVFSNFTTAPSTAPFTPPPELATHMTTPSSPDVPFAQLLANSFGTKAVVRSQPPPTHSASPFASPDIFAAEDLQAAYQLYPGSPLAHLLSPTSGTGASTPLPDSERSTQFTPFQDLENPVQAVASMFIPGSPMPPPDSAPGLGLEVGPVLTQTSNSQISDSCSSKLGKFPPFQDSDPAGQQQQQQQQQLSATISSFLASGDNPSGPKLVGCAQFGNGERLIIGLNNGSSGQKATPARVTECEVVHQSIEEERISEATVDCENKGESNAELAGLVLSNETSTQFKSGNTDSSDEAEKNVPRSELALPGDTSVEFQSGKIESLDQAGKNVEPSGLVMSDENSVLLQPGSTESSDGAGRNIGLPELILSDNSTFQLPLAELESTDQKDGSVEHSESVSPDDTDTAVQSQSGGLQPSDQADRNVVLSGLILSADGKAVKPVNVELADVADRSMGHSGLVLPECGVASKQEPPDQPDVIPGYGGPSSDANPSQLGRGKIESCDKPERDFSQIAVCSLGPVQTFKRSPGGDNGALDCSEAVGQNNVCLRQPSSSVLDVTIGDLVAWETLAGDKIPKKLSISKIALLDPSRAGSAVHSRSSSRDSASMPGTSPLRRPSDAGICTDCVRLQHVTVAATEGYFDTSAPEQFSFTNPKFNPEANCGEEKGKDSGIGGNVESKCGVLKVLLESPTGVPSKDRGGVYREQQRNLPVKWIQAGAKLNQKSPDQVPREVTELGSICSGSQNVPSPSLGMNLVEELK